MTRSMCLVIVGSLCVVAVASANAPPPRPFPLPKDHKYIDAPVRFEGVEKHPDYVFHLNYWAIGTEFGNKQTIVQVKDSKAFNLKGPINRFTEFALVATERKLFAQRDKEDRSLKWLDPETKGVLRTEITPPATTAPESVKEVPVKSYRVSFESGKLVVETDKEKKS